MSTPEKDVMAKGLKKEEVRINRAALAILRNLQMAFKVSKIYDPTNQIVQTQTHILLSLLAAVFREEGDIVFLLRQSTLFFNGSRVRFAFNNYDLFKFLAGEMKRRGIGLLQIIPELTEEELKNFLALLARKPSREQTSFKEFTQGLAQKKIVHVSAEPPWIYDDFQGGQREAIRIFFLGIAHLKELFEKFKQGGSLPLNITRRLMHSLFSHIVNDESFVLGLTNIKNFDEYTLNHSLNVCVLSIALSRRLGLDKRELTDLGISAFFHDYGKMEIPREILDKPGKLEKEERELVQTHPQRGAEKLFHLKETNALPVEAISVAMEHHIREDSNSYPVYYKKKNISFFSKIVKVCDVFDALTTQRPYREHTYTRNEALAVMAADFGQGFDPIILKVFVQMMGLYPVGSLVQLDTNELAIVFEPHPEPSLSNRPKVRLITEPSGKKIGGDIVDLTETDPETQKPRRSIVRSLDPSRYDVRVADYFLDQALSNAAGPRPG